MSGYRPRTNSEWGFLGAIVGQAVCATALDIAVLWKYFSWVTPLVYQVQQSYSIPVNCGLIIFGLCYQSVLTVDALHTRNNVQMYNICVFNALLLTFIAMSYGQTAEVISGLSTSRALGDQPLVDLSVDLWASVRLLLLTLSVVVAIATLGLFFYGYKLHNEFAWAIYRHVRGSRQMRQWFLMYKVLVVFIKVELYFFIGFLLLYGLVNVHFEVPEFPLIVCLLLSELVQIALALYFTKTENTLGAIIAIAFRLAQIAYLVSRIVVLCGNGIRANTILKNEMLLFAGSALAFNAFICINSVLCITNFGCGLKPLLSGEISNERQPYEFHSLGYQPANQSFVSRRLSLD
ncbi:hypothetical protein DM02DRAFT_545403 [Periconia macrospinosa]|uniref:TRP C-terminal domain-containing protein n=1 Tax=Periconia macrospinosa TaxID=97972 RepID=A0A2V1D0X3_9PLEO|nr:hypothetical protein DM02DRAFT_545403 [Periconia macrospinosa]